MKRLMSIVVVASAFAALLVSAAFGAGGKGHQPPITAMCTTSGNVTVHASSGQSAWVNNTHWVVLRFTGTFTPAGSTTSQTFTKVYGHKAGLVKRGTAQSCTGTQTDSSGTFSFTATVAKTTR
jgi:hypothetical protein